MLERGTSAARRRGDQQMLAVLSGLAAGCVHVVAGPDHLAAVAPIAAENPRRAAASGFKWGLGHGLGALCIGLLAMGLRHLIDVEAVSAWMEFLVGFMLIGIGVWAFRRASQLQIHVHKHEHDGDAHKHIHVHDEAAIKEHNPAEHAHSHAALYVGALHGAAGTGHLLAVLPSLALPPLDAVMYLIAYFIAAVLSMTAFGAVLGYIANGKRIRWTMYLSSCVSIVIGCYWLSITWPV
jgi:ABC-type nickel/cobalt efflux system permease component RcnA